MRKINKIVIHCSASDDQKFNNIKTIREWHRANQWAGTGYHYFIRNDGTIELGRPISRSGAHTKGHNSDSIGICLHGLNKFSEAQFISAARIVKNLTAIFGLKKKDVYPHNYFTDLKTCPNFDLKQIFEKMDFIKNNF